METANNLPALKRFKKIPVYVVEEHNDALQFIYSAIGRNRLPLEGTTLLHLDAHPDMLIDRKLKGVEARSGRNVLPLLQIENWIVPAAAAGHIARIVWLHPPWAKQFTDGNRCIRVGDHPVTGMLRVDSKEPYYLSDALYSTHLNNSRTFNLTVRELTDLSSQKDKDFVENLVKSLSITTPYVLDIDLDFFSTGNPFLALYENISLYDRLEPIFNFKLPDDETTESVEKFIDAREKQIEELEALFQHLEANDNLNDYRGEKSKIFEMVSELAQDVSTEARRKGETVDWWAVYAGGCTRDQGGLPFHISTEEEISTMVHGALKPLLRALPPPVLITIARSTEDGYCPSHQVDFIQSLVLKAVQEVYVTDEAALHYLTVDTSA